MKVKKTLKYYGEIGSVPEDYTLITDSQEVEEIKGNYGNAKELEPFDSFFVKEKNGDYEEILCFHGIIPVNSKPVYRFTQELI